MDRIFKILDELGVNYGKYEHEPVKTCAESTALLPSDMPGVRTKHLFLRDRKRENYFVVVVDEKKMVDLKELSDQLNVKSLGMASEEDLMKSFEVEAGALSMLSFINEKSKDVRFLVDQDIWHAEAFDCHPNVSSVVLLIYKEDWMKIFEYIKRMPEIVHIPEKEE